MMFPVETLTLLAFIPAALALNFTPGADMMLCIGQGLRGGPKAAVSASAGVSLGGMIHATIAGLGLGAAVAAAPWLFDAIRWIGVAYLLWLAAKALRQPLGGKVPTDVSPKRAFRDGLIVNLTNPKVIFFVLAFIPQFVDPGRNVLAQFLIFGAILAFGGLIMNGLAGVFASGLGRRAAQSTGVAQVLGWVSASIFGFLALRLALLERS